MTDTLPAPAPTEPWITSYSGRAISLLYPRPSDIHGVDIANALAKLNRFTGHTKKPYSVAQHSLLVAELAIGYGDRCGPECLHPDLYLYALLHDGHEAYLGDRATPIQHAEASFEPRFSIVRKNMECVFDLAIFGAFGLDPVMPDDVARRVRAADKLALVIERRDILAPGPAWDGDYPETDGIIPIADMPWYRARDFFASALARGLMRRHRDIFIHQREGMDAPPLSALQFPGDAP